MAGTPEATSCFVLIIQGSLPWAGVVDGIEGVKEALVRILWTDPEQVLLEDVAAALASLDEPEAWAPHGAGDEIRIRPDRGGIAFPVRGR